MSQRSFSEQTKDFRAKQIAAGKCIWCPNPSETDCGLCISCRNKNRIRARNRYRLRVGMLVTEKLWSHNHLAKIN